MHPERMNYVSQNRPADTGPKAGRTRNSLFVPI